MFPVLGVHSHQTRHYLKHCKRICAQVAAASVTIALLNWGSTAEFHTPCKSMRLTLLIGWMAHQKKIYYHQKTLTSSTW